MKKLLSTILLGFIGISLSSCTRYGIYDDADKYLVGNQTYNENITSLDIDWVSGTLTIVEDETISGVKIEEETNLTNEKELVHSYLDNGELKIKFFASGYSKSGFRSFKKNLTLTYHPGITDLEIGLTSGTFNANSLTADKVDVDLTSGTANINTITATEVDVDLTSGSANIDKITANEVDVDFTSGRATINHIDANEFDSDMTSGSMTVAFDKVNKASFGLTSGSIDMTLPSDGGTVKVNKTSGSVNAIRECTISNNIYTFGEGSADIDVGMTSGKLIIR